MQARAERLNLAVAVTDAEIASLQHTPRPSSEPTIPPQHPFAAHPTHAFHHATAAHSEPAAHLSLEYRSATGDLHTHAAFAPAALPELPPSTVDAPEVTSIAALAAAAGVAAAANSAASPHGTATAAAARTAVMTRSATEAAAARSAAHLAVEGLVEPGGVPPPAEPFAQDPAQGVDLMCSGQGVQGTPDVGGLGGYSGSSQLGSLAEGMHRDVREVREFLGGLAGPQVCF